MKEVIERCNWLVNNCENMTITPDVKDDVRYLLEEIERLNNILNTLMQDMAVLNATGTKEIKPKYVFDRIAILRGVDKE